MPGWRRRSCRGGSSRNVTRRVGPVNFHSYTAHFWEGMLHSHSIVGVIDFTTGPGDVAEATMNLKIPYVGFVQTPSAERMVNRYLFKRTWDLMCKPGSSHFEPKLRDLVIGAGGSPGGGETPSAPQPVSSNAGSGGQAGGGTASKSSKGAGTASSGPNQALMAALKALNSNAKPGPPAANTARGQMLARMLRKSPKTTA